MEENEFRSVINKKQNGSFGRSVIVPFISGVLGCSLVLGTCFGVPNIREKIIGENNSQNATSYENAGIVNPNLVSLSNYSDTAVFAASKILPSIVGISITYDVTTSNYFSMFGFGGGNTTSQATASGSGIIISEDGYIVTNNHVVSSESQSTYYEISEAKSIKIKLFNDETQYDATIIGKDSQTDLAVLKIEKTGLTAAEFADSSSRSHAWFTGFAPAVNPEVCITVVIEGAGSGGDYAVPTARRVLDAYVIHLNFRLLL